MIRRIAVATAVCGVLGALAIAPPAWAAPTTEIIEGRYVQLVSVADWERAADLAPGETMRWDVEISADAPEPGMIEIAVSATGGTPLVVDAALCLDAWRGDECPSDAETLVSDWEVPRDGAQVPLREIDAEQVAHLRLHVGVGPGSVGDVTEMRVHANGASDELDTGPDLPPTGGWSSEPWLLAGGALLLVGAGALLFARARQRRDGGDSS